MKRYTVRISNKDAAAITTISNYSDLKELLSGTAKGCLVETKMSENMPLTLHNMIAKHNSERNDEECDARKAQ